MGVQGSRAYNDSCQRLQDAEGHLTQLRQQVTQQVQDQAAEASRRGQAQADLKSAQEGLAKAQQERSQQDLQLQQVGLAPLDS